MIQENYTRLNREAWDTESREYQEAHREELDLNLEDIFWGFGLSKESELSVLGNVSGKAILELGCGGAQCSVSLSRHHAFCIGLDVSRNQLQFARELVELLDVDIPLVLANGEDLPFSDSCFDIVFCVFGAIGFIDARRSFKEVFRVLRPGGLFAFSWYHPFFDCFPRKGENQLKVIKSYFDRSSLVEHKKKIDGTVITYIEFHHTLSDYFDMLTQAGFTIIGLIEPESPKEDAPTTWSEAPLYKIRMIPSTIVLKARKPSSSVNGL